MFMWLGPLAGFLKFGTDGYPRAVQRRLRIVNAMALLIAVFSVIYAAGFRLLRRVALSPSDRRQPVTSRGFRSTTSLPRRSRLQFTACRISA